MISQKALKLIAHHEGVRTKPYQCPAKLWTIGVGHVIDPNHGKLKIEDRVGLPCPAGWNRTFTMEEVNAILVKDLERFLHCRLRNFATQHIAAKAQPGRLHRSCRRIFKVLQSRWQSPKRA